MSIILPYLLNLGLFGFESIFKENEIDIGLESQIVVFLGGNGLGKTTTLQCLVYALAGGLDNLNLEPVKNLRWDHKYFRGRVPESHLNSSFVEVKFKLGDANITVQRGFNGSKIKHGSVVSGSISSAFESDEDYEEIICRLGNYDNFDDFRFLVHRLLYLAEDRRGITWDLDAQARIFMLLNKEFINEEEFRTRRAKVKELDSNKRHLRVRIGKIQEELKNYAQELETLEEKEKEDNDVPVQNLPPVDLKQISENLINLTKSKEKLLQYLSSLEEQEKKQRATISELSEKQRRIEADLISRSLAGSNNAAHLYLRKLLDYGTCPSCGKYSKDLKELAQQNVRNGKCAICGESYLDTFISDEIEIIGSQLSEKIQAKNHIDLQISDFRYKLEEVQREEISLRTTFELARLATVQVSNTQKSLEPSKLPFEALKAELEELYQEHRSLENLIEEETTLLDSEYEQYISSSKARIERLSDIFKELATQFLGKEVSLIERSGEDKFLKLTLFKPVFDGVIRETPEHCSEAQRFFLDIAMRLSILQLNSELSRHKNSFICETPESALDVSYIDNVAAMFKNFVTNGHSLIASINLQRLGLAQTLLSHAKSQHFTYYIFDLLKHGRLSDVQEKSKELFKIRDEILEGAEK